MVLDNLVQKKTRVEKLEGRPPKHLKEPLKRKKASRPIKDKWEVYRPLKRTWICEECNFTIKRDPDIDSIDFPCPCGGRFSSTQIIEKTSKDTNTEYGLILFLESRKGNGKQQCQDILQIIFEKENEDIDGFVAFREIYHGINSKYKVSRNELTRLLTDMEKNHIVYKIIREDQSVNTPNKNRIYYKFNSLALVRTYTKEGMKKEYSKYVKMFLEASHRKIFAEAVLFRHGLLQEYHDNLKKWEEKRENASSDF